VVPYRNNRFWEIFMPQPHPLFGQLVLIVGTSAHRIRSMKTNRMMVTDVTLYDCFGRFVFSP
jgi:hypothetical protein